MQFLTSLFGGSENVFLTAVLSLGIVIVLIIIGVWALKLLSKATSSVPRGSRRRLSLVDSIAVDAKRRLVIVRRDNVEHLIMTGGPQDVLVESGIAVEAPKLPSRRPVPTPSSGGQSLPQAKGAEPKQRESVDSTPLVAEEAHIADDLHESPPTAMDRLRELGRSRDQRRPTSLRHTGLLRPITRMEPGMISAIADNSDHLIADSAKEGRVETLDSRRGGDGQAKGGSGKRGLSRK